MNPPSDFLLIERINQCPKLASLQSINDTLANLLDSEDSFVGQIAEVIRLDPSLTTRVLDLVNSIFFGSKEDHHITGVEEASIFLGLNRIRELLAATPIIEEISALGKNNKHFSWESFWRHSIGTAILTREILSIAEHKVEQEADYVAGLLHNLGILILAITFPEIFPHVYGKTHESLQELTDKEISLVGWDHAKMGAYYLWNHHISEEIVEAVHSHNHPEKATVNPKLAASVQIATFLVRSLKVKGLEKLPHPEMEEIQNLEGWKILFEEEKNDDPEIINERILSSVERLGQTLQTII
jgi:HD-like signal output (HDOD) protein